MKVAINTNTEMEAIYLKVDAGIRYWQDAYINGSRDTDCDETDGISQYAMC